MSIDDVNQCIDRAIPAQEFLIREEWQEPRPLPNKELLPVLSFEVDTMLPNPLRSFVEDISHRMQVPPDLTAVFSVTAFSSLLGTNYRIHPKRHDNWSEAPNLWSIGVAPPGSLKTPCLDEAMKPIKALAQKAHKQFEDDNRIYLQKVDEIEAKKKNLTDLLKKAEKRLREATAQKKEHQLIENEITEYQEELQKVENLKAPKLKRYMTNDSTIEKLQEILKHNSRGILVIRDEIISLLDSFAIKGRESDRGFYLSGWGGKSSYDVDRIGRGSFSILHHCITLVGTTQPAKLQDYILKLVIDGFLQRFIIVYPDFFKKDYIDQCPDKATIEAVYKIAAIIDSDDFLKSSKSKALTANNELLHFSFESVGQERFKQWLIGLEEQIDKEGNALIKEVLSKYRGLIPSLALIFHVVTIALTGQDKNTPVTLDMLNMAIRWHPYLESHARRIYGIKDNVVEVAAASLAKKIKDGTFGREFSVRDVYSKRLAGIGRNTEIAATACETLAQLYWLREIHDSGVKGTRYEVNPFFCFKIY